MRQSFSHGRSKAVVVEKVKRRIAAPGETKPDAALVQERAANGEAAQPPGESRRRARGASAGTAAAPSQSKPGVVLRPLTKRKSAPAPARLAKPTGRGRGAQDRRGTGRRPASKKRLRKENGAEAEARKTHEAEPGALTRTKPSRRRPRSPTSALAPKRHWQSRVPPASIKTKKRRRRGRAVGPAAPSYGLPPHRNRSEPAAKSAAAG